jgi:uncharacterized cupredoxin-like copper-binding protein
MSGKLAVAGLALAAVVGVTFGMQKGAWPTRAVAHTDHKFAAGEPGDPKKASRPMLIALRDGPGTMTYAPNKIEVRLGEQIKFTLKNIGHLDHEFLLDSLENNAKHKIEMEKNPEMEHDEPNGKRIKSNETAEILWKFTKKGTFEFACLIPGHYEAGMKGVVIVK